jgi:hypothetical protein
LTYTPYVWGHIDDILNACPEEINLLRTMDLLLAKLTLAGWRINKSIVKLSRKITYLGSTWGSFAVKRKTQASLYLERLWNYIATIKLKGRQLQRV